MEASTVSLDNSGHSTWSHLRRLVKNIGWENQNIGRKKVVKSDKCMGVSQLLGGTCPCCPYKSTPILEALIADISLGWFL